GAGGPAQPAGARPGLALRAALFDRLAAVLDGRKRLLLAPDGDLTRLPFEVLPAENGRCLIDEYRISYLGTGRDVLRFAAETTGRPAPPLVVADPAFDLTEVPAAAVAERPGRFSRGLARGRYHFRPLPGTGREGGGLVV